LLAVSVTLPPDLFRIFCFSFLVSLVSNVVGGKQFMSLRQHCGLCLIAGIGELLHARVNLPQLGFRGIARGNDLSDARIQRAPLADKRFQLIIPLLSKLLPKLGSIRFERFIAVHEFHARF
jgi:hypothetical protein